MVKKVESPELSKLRCVRIFDPNHIPKEYIEQIKEREFDVERFYTYQKAICVEESGETFKLNPLNLLFSLVDEQNRVKGVLWMVIDVLGNSLVINTFSVDKEYWGNGHAIELLKEKALEIKEGAKLDRVYWVTRCPKHSEKHGFKRSKNTLMEFKDYGKHDDGIGCQAGRESRPDVEGSEKLS